jgi:hypothetical protein
LVDLTTAPNNVGGLTAFNSLSGASMAYTDINSFAVGAVAGGDGFNTVNGNITLQANSGVLGLNGGVNAGNATVTLITPGNISRAGSGAIAAATVNLNLSSGSAAHTWTITPTHFTDAGFNGVPYSAVTNLTIQGGTGNETYNVTPSSNTTFNLHGNNPTPPASPGDSLFVDFTGTTGPVVNKTSTPNGFQGAFTFGNRKPVNFTTIETLNCTSPTPITMTCPSSIAKFTDPGQRSAIVTPVKPVASGGCANPSVTGVRNDGKPLNAPYPVGPTIITWTATDGINSTSCAQTIVVMAPSGGRRQP